jgi:hypothetical protein
MTKLTGAALDRAVAHAMGLKSVHNCEKWSGAMGEDDDIQDYKKPWVGLTDAEIDGYLDWDDWQIGTDRSIILGMVRDIEAKLKRKNT